MFLDIHGCRWRQNDWSTRSNETEARKLVGLIAARIQWKTSGRRWLHDCTVLVDRHEFADRSIKRRYLAGFEAIEASVQRQRAIAFAPGDRHVRAEVVQLHEDVRFDPGGKRVIVRISAETML